MGAHRIFRALITGVFMAGLLSGCAGLSTRSEAPSGVAGAAAPEKTEQGAASLESGPRKPAGPAVRAQGMRTNLAGITIIKSSEGLHLNAYQDMGQWLIGYGHAKRVRPGMRITSAEAEDFLAEDLGVCETAIGGVVLVPITSNQFSALVSLCYNVGPQPIVASTLIKKLNAGDHWGAADAFLDWTKATVNGAKVTLDRLLARRQRERALFLEGLKPPAA